MKLLNPLFDTVFKYLMEDMEIAKSIISAIIKKEIIELLPAPQESTTIDLKIKYSQIAITRQDYVAIIKSQNKDEEEIEKVIVEVQKSPFIPEIGRFRSYLSDKYRQKSIFSDKEGAHEKYLSIKTIYLIEETFNENLPAILGRKGLYYDEIENTIYEGKRDEVVELFNHDSWFIQTELLPLDFKNELLYILSVFTPWYRKKTSDRYIEVPDDDLLIKKHRILERILRRLQAATQDKEINRSVELEIEYEDFIEKKLAEAKLYKELSIENLQAKEQAEAKAEQERQAKEQAEAKAEHILKNAILSMNKNGIAVSVIAASFQLSEDEVKRIIAENI